MRGHIVPQKRDALDDIKRKSRSGSTKIPKIITKTHTHITHTHTHTLHVFSIRRIIILPFRSELRCLKWL